MSQNPQHPTSGEPGYDPPPAGAQQGYRQPTPGGEPGYGRPAAPGGYGGAPAPLGGDERSMMMIAHLSAPVAMLVSVGWLPFLGPLLVWLFYKDRSRAVRTAAAGAFNFNISMTIASVLTWISVILTLGIGFLWAVPIWIVLFVVQIVVHVRGALAASRGEVYDYPFQVPILS